MLHHIQALTIRLAEPRSQSPVLLLKFLDSNFEVRKLCFAAITGGLGGEAVAMGSGFTTLVGGQVGARAFAR